MEVEKKTNNFLVWLWFILLLISILINIYMFFDSRDSSGIKYEGLYERDMSITRSEITQLQAELRAMLSDFQQCSRNVDAICGYVKNTDMHIDNCNNYSLSAAVESWQEKINN